VAVTRLLTHLLLPVQPYSGQQGSPTNDYWLAWLTMGEGSKMTSRLLIFSGMQACSSRISRRGMQLVQCSAFVINYCVGYGNKCLRSRELSAMPGV
jgi:hypothetical protein